MCLRNVPSRLVGLPEVKARDAVTFLVKLALAEPYLQRSRALIKRDKLEYEKIWSGKMNADHKAELLGKLGPRSIRLMKRCFMTGKQCIFSSQIAERAGKEVGLTDLKAFVIMPFTPILETFYLWSLKPFLTKDYGLLDENVQRADEVRDIGYIVCEKICRKIQQADFVLADVTLRNANVSYELGLSYGLERPIVLLEDEQSNDDVLEDPCFRQSLKRDRNSALRYPGIEELDADSTDHELTRFVMRPPKHKGHTGDLKISFLRVQRGVGEGQDTGRLGHDLDLRRVIPAVVGVAMADIRTDVKQKGDGKVLEPWEDVVTKIDDTEWKEFASAKPIVVDGRGGFTDVSGKIESSFCTIIDVSDNDPVACFWLGYCHARGLNVIPVYRLKDPAKKPAQTEHDSDRGPKLAFDIRALWYAEYEGQKPYAFKTKMREILEHLLQRDLPDRQKRRFWDRFPPERKLKVFTGAIHNTELNREMVGDWDVRTVSELSSYLPSGIEALALELVTPLYLPEEAYRRLADPDKEPAVFIEKYNKSIQDQLKGSNAIVIASPDVNPVTEYLLHKIYKVTAPDEPFLDCKVPDFNGYVAWKRLQKASHPPKGNESSCKKEQSSESDGKSVKFNRLFYRQEEVKGKATRGFGIQTLRKFQEQPELMKEYLSQDECTKEFSLLGHLVIARNPADEQNGNLVVLLNGVSGPATFALAQILTGGVFGRPEMRSQSEQMLQQINQELDKPGALGVQAIIEVRIAPPPPDPAAQLRTYIDNREVHSWEFLKSPEAIT